MINQEKDSQIFTLKLSDFGWACQIFADNRQTLCGTPECINLF